MTIRNVDWMDLALCAEVGPSFFFPTRGDSHRPAKRICAACPVRVECSDYATAELATDTDHGLWGGEGPLARRARRTA